MAYYFSVSEIKYHYSPYLPRPKISRKNKTHPTKSTNLWKILFIMAYGPLEHHAGEDVTVGRHEREAERTEGVKRGRERA